MAPQLLLLGLVLNFLMFIDAQPVGVCNGRLGSDLPSAEEVVKLYEQYGITRMRIYDPNPATLQALRRSTIELMLDVPNDVLQSLNDPSAATTWVQKHILDYAGVKFRYIAVGNEVDPYSDIIENRKYVDFVLPAMKNVHRAIVAAGLDREIKVSTATYTGLLNNSYPPSAGSFNETVSTFIGPIIAFLDQNNLPMLANIYPYFAATEDSRVRLPYALFLPAPPENDEGSGLVYNNLFDAMLDAHYAAQARLPGGGNLEIVVSESGWPSSGHSLATPENAGTYYRNLIAHVKQGKGTPARPGRSVETYLFAMFDENDKGGKVSEKHFGLFNPSNKQPKYQLSF